jgi:hypothetical protein
VETLCRTLSKLRTSTQAGLLRSLVKDMLIGDYRRPDLTHDTQYAQLKACLKVLLPDEMSVMPPQSVELTRLQDLLRQVQHPEDIKALAWPFLNAFSPDLIKQVIDAPISAAVGPAAQADIGARVLDLVCAQARAHGIELPPLVAQLPHKPSPVEVRRTYIRPMPLSRAEKLRGKVLHAQAQGIFLKGPPGAGKTHLVETLIQGKPVFWASIADEGTTAFGDQLHAWATTGMVQALLRHQLQVPGNHRAARVVRRVSHRPGATEPGPRVHQEHHRPRGSRRRMAALASLA